ncbi:hypothetical protein [Holospora curviuscula]|uniref:4Fe-4S ferredoxin-type domain-containing protein n=1 Tax=Holospora curviuscula TaxID=1082868 RepID=A0A2S5R873_9PROT|nr:hypothetical protein [Holospora curviuscula]PPE03382.1 hypothetical protein HCUR_01176 [Holospora curviuscula]
MNKTLLTMAILLSSIASAEDKPCCGSQTITSVTPCGVCSTKSISVCVPECNSCTTCCE